MGTCRKQQRVSQTNLIMMTMWLNKKLVINTGIEWVTTSNILIQNLFRYLICDSHEDSCSKWWGVSAIAGQRFQSILYFQIFQVQESPSALVYDVCLMDRCTIAEIWHDNVQVILCSKPHSSKIRYGTYFLSVDAFFMRDLVRKIVKANEVSIVITSCINIITSSTDTAHAFMCHCPYMLQPNGEPL